MPFPSLPSCPVLPRRCIYCSRSEGIPTWIPQYCQGHGVNNLFQNRIFGFQYQWKFLKNPGSTLQF
jgi:hypothetical protein